MARFHWSEEDLANASGVPKETISRLLAGRRETSFPNAGRIIRTFGFARGWQMHLLFGLVGVTELDSAWASLDYEVARTASGATWSDSAHTRMVNRELELDEPRLPESPTSEFERVVRLVALGFWVEPSEMRHDRAREDYIDKVLRHAARVNAVAAWALATYFVLELGRPLTPPAIWCMYRLARRGQWPVEVQPRRPNLGGRESLPRRWRDRNWRTESRYRPNRGLAIEENIHIMRWTWKRDWTRYDSAVPDEDVLRTLNEVASRPLPEDPESSTVFDDDPDIPEAPD